MWAIFADCTGAMERDYADLEHVGEQEQETGVHAGAQAYRGKDAQPHPPHKVLHHMLCRFQPSLLLACSARAV